jgi:hypothetical protein
MSPSSSPLSTSGPVYSRRFKVVAAVVLAAAIALFSAAYLVATEDDDDPSRASSGSRAFVEDLLPPEDSQVVQQSTVGIDLATGWQGVLRLNGEEVPDDQLTQNQALNLVQFTPGSGKVLERLPIGRMCVQALVWRSAAGRGNGERTVSWCFEVI